MAHGGKPSATHTMKDHRAPRPNDIHLESIREEADVGNPNISESVKMLDAVSVSVGPELTKSARADEPAPFRTRWLYFTLFIFNACGGRFMSLYYLAEGLDESEIGYVFAAGSLTGPFMCTFVGVLADQLALKSRAARHWCLAACVVVGTIAFTLQAVHFPGISRFAGILACRVVWTGCNNSAGVLSDAITVQGLKDRKEYGQERLYGAVSWAIMHLLLGVLIDMYGRMVQHVCIIVAAVLVIFTLGAIGVPPVGEVEEEPAVENKKKPGLAALADRGALRTLLGTYLSSKLMLAFFFYAATLGYGMTIVENLVFLLFRELNASYFLCGVSVVVTVVFEVPLFARSKWALENLGVPALLSLAGLCYSFRVVGYTLCPGGWYILLFEPMHGVTIAASGTASVELVASMTPPAFTATGQALLNLVRSSIGGALGSSIGGAVIRQYGESACYRLSAVIVMSGLCVYRTSLWLAPPTTEKHSAVEQEEDPSPPASLGRPA